MTEALNSFEGNPEALADAWQTHLEGHQAPGVVYDRKTGYADTTSKLDEVDGAVEGHGEMGPGARELSPRDTVLGLGKAVKETTEANVAVKGDDGTTNVVDGLTLDEIIDRADGEK